MGGGAGSDSDQLGGARSSCDEVFELSIRRVLKLSLLFHFLLLLLLFSLSRRLGGFLFFCKHHECSRFLSYCA